MRCIACVEGRSNNRFDNRFASHYHRHDASHHRQPPHFNRGSAGDTRPVAVIGTCCKRAGRSRFYPDVDWGIEAALQSRTWLKTACRRRELRRRRPCTARFKARPTRLRPLIEFLWLWLHWLERHFEGTKSSLQPFLMPGHLLSISQRFVAEALKLGLWMCSMRRKSRFLHLAGTCGSALPYRGSCWHSCPPGQGCRHSR